MKKSCTSAKALTANPKAFNMLVALHRDGKLHGMNLTPSHLNWKSVRDLCEEDMIKWIEILMQNKYSSKGKHLQ